VPGDRPAPPRAAPVQAVLGAGLAVGGVALVIGGLLVATGGRTGADAVGATASGVRTATSAPAPGATAPLPARPAPRPAPTRAPAAAPPARPAASTPAARRAAAVPLPAPPAPSRPALVVLNNSRVPCLAARAAARVERAGWPVQLVGSYRGRIRATTVYYPAGQRSAAERLAAAVPAVARVLPRPARVPGPPGLVLVVTRASAS
jgi:hypothetical protein